MIRAVFYIGPLVVWMVLALALSTRIGRYDASVEVLYAVFAYLAPDMPRPNVSAMYAINYLARRSAFVFEYGVLTLLLIRALQFGAPRLRKRTVIAAVAVAIVFAGADDLMRAVTPERHGGLDDISMNLLGVALVLGGSLIFFVVKEWERRLAATEDPAAIQ